LLWFVSCFGMGLAVLAKGLVGVLLPAMIIGLYLLITGRLLALLKRPSLLLFGALVFLATTATWYVPMYLRNGQEFINEFFIAHHFQRFLTNKYRHPQPFYFFFFVAFVGCFPWLWFFGQQIVDSIKHWREILKAQNQRLRLFLWLWTLIPIIFFSLSTSKLTGYILPVFPAIALLIGLELDKLWQGTETLRWRWVHLLTPLLMLIVSIGVGLKADDELAVSSRTTWIVGGLGIAVSITHLFLLLRNVRTATLFLPFAMAAMMVATKLMFLPGLAYVESTRDLALTAARSVRPGERLIFFINNHFSIDFYATDLPLRDEKSYLLTLMKPKEIEDLMKSQPTQSLLVISRERWSPGLTELMQAEELGKQGELVLLRVRPK
ncbi:MAG TPA: hypothetical protein VEF04_22625, partial [Blastocatellia bacterium]|nr:hypothetical protein [Blastocatellia bacterium]